MTTSQELKLIPKDELEHLKTPTHKRPADLTAGSYEMNNQETFSPAIGDRVAAPKAANKLNEPRMKGKKGNKIEPPQRPKRLYRAEPTQLEHETRLEENVRSEAFKEMAGLGQGGFKSPKMQSPTSNHHRSRKGSSSQQSSAKVSKFRSKLVAEVEGEHSFGRMYPDQVEAVLKQRFGKLYDTKNLQSQFLDYIQTMELPPIDSSEKDPSGIATRQAVLQVLRAQEERENAIRQGTSTPLIKGGRLPTSAKGDSPMSLRPKKVDFSRLSEVHEAAQAQLRKIQRNIQRGEQLLRRDPSKQSHLTRDLSKNKLSSSQAGETQATGLAESGKASTPSKRMSKSPSSPLLKMSQIGKKRSLLNALPTPILKGARVFSPLQTRDEPSAEYVMQDGNQVNMTPGPKGGALTKSNSRQLLQVPFEGKFAAHRRSLALEQVHHTPMVTMPQRSGSVIGEAAKLPLFEQSQPVDSNVSQDSIQYQPATTPSEKVGLYRPDSIQQSQNYPIMEEVEEDAMNTYYKERSRTEMKEPLHTFQRRAQSIVQKPQPLISPDSGTPFGPPMDVAKNFVARNAALLPSVLKVKANLTTQTLDSLRALHAQIQRVKPITAQTTQLDALQKAIAPHLRQFYFQETYHAKTIQAVNQLNSLFQVIISVVKNYRVELGTGLELAVESYSALIIQQYENFYRKKLAKEVELGKMIERCDEQMKQLDSLRQQVEDERRVRTELVVSKDVTIQKLEQEISDYKTANDRLRLLMEEDRVTRKGLHERYMKVVEETKKEGLIGMDAVTVAGGKVESAHEKDKRRQLKRIEDGDTRAELLWLEEQQRQLEMAHGRLTKDEYAKVEAVQEMRKVVNQLAMKHSKNKPVQTDLSVWNQYADKAILFKAENDEPEEDRPRKYPNVTAGDLDDTEERELHEQRDAKFEEAVVEAGIRLVEQPNAVALQEKNAEGLYTKQPPGQRPTDTGITSPSVSPTAAKGNQGLMIKEAPQLGMPKDFELEAASARWYASSMRQNGLRQRHHLQHLHDQFAEMCLKIKAKREEGMEKRATNGLRFLIPFNLIAFMANEISWWLKKPEEEVEGYQLMPWKDLKRVIFDFYDHRLEHAAEVNGLANNQYCAMNEYLLVYLLDVYKDRKKVEKAMFDLFINLRYYYDQQTRVKVFCQNLEVAYIRDPKAREKLEEQAKKEADEYGDPLLPLAPHGTYGDAEVPENDIYAQEFFLHAYAVFTSMKDGFLESREGITYMKHTDEQRVAKRIIATLRGPCGNIEKWSFKVEQMVQVIPVGQQDTEFVDVDKLLYNLLYEYKNQRGAFQKSLEREFMRWFDTYYTDMACDFDTFARLVDNTNMSQTINADYLDPLVSYPGHITTIRAYAFALTAGRDNNSKFNAENFVAALSRFGIEVPAPNVSQRCQNYGNSQTIMAQLRVAEETYGKLSMKVHYKKYMAAPLEHKRPQRPILGNIKVELRDEEEKRRAEEELQLGEEEDDDADLAHPVKVIEANETLIPEGSTHADPVETIDDMHSGTYIEHKPPEAVEGTVTSRIAGALDKEVLEEAQRNLLNVRSKKTALSGVALAGNVRYRIQNIKQFGDVYQEDMLRKLHAAKIDQGREKEAQLIADEINQLAKSRRHRVFASDAGEDPDASPVLINDDEDSRELQTELAKTNDRLKREFTLLRYTSKHRQIMLPDFSTTAKVFNEHLILLADLKHRIKLLRQAYYKQMDKERTWAQVDEIIVLLDNGCEFLDFPREVDLAKNTLVEHKGQMVNQAALTAMRRLQEETRQKMEEKKRQLDAQAAKPGLVKFDTVGIEQREKQIEEVDEEDEDGSPLPTGRGRASSKESWFEQKSAVQEGGDTNEQLKKEETDPSVSQTVD